MDKEKSGRLIGALRREQGMTQQEFAARLHVSDRTVSKWERGAAPCSSAMPSAARASRATRRAASSPSTTDAPLTRARDARASDCELIGVAHTSPA